MELTVHKPGESVLSDKPRSSRIKKTYLDKWKDYDLEFNNSPKFRNRKRAPLIREDEKLVDLSKRKINKNSVSVSDEIIPQEKPFGLNYDIKIPKRPRCISKQKKFSACNNNILPYKKRKQEEFNNFFEEGKNVNSSMNSSPNGRFVRPKGKCDNEFVKKRRRFYEVCYNDMDPYWIIKQRIRVFWPLDKTWYFGTVKDYDSKSKKHNIKYDDHEEEWVNLKNERFKLLLYPNEILTGDNRVIKGNNNMNIINNKLSQTNNAAKNSINFVYFRKRFHNREKKIVKPEVILEFYLPIKGIFLFWINRLPLFDYHGKLVPISQKVCFEMALIDNILGLRIFNFEGYLNQAIDIICFIISRFCPKKVIRKNTGVEMKKSMPCASIGIKIIGQKREIYLLTYRFHELGSLKLGLIEGYLNNKNCLKTKELSIASCTYNNLRKLSHAKDLLWPCKGLYEDVISRNATNFKMDPETVYIYKSSLSPCLFLNMHLKFLMGKNTLARPVHKKPNSILLWDKNKTDLDSVSPTSVLSNDQNTPRSKKPRTLVSYTPLEKETQNLNSNSNSNLKYKTHYRKKHAWKQFNTSSSSNMEIPRVKTKAIPTPGVHLMHGSDGDFSGAHLMREPLKYHREIKTEVERCMDPSHVVYDMDTDDENWVQNYNNNNNNNNNKFGEDIFERVIDSFEKFSYVKKCDELTATGLEEIAKKYNLGGDLNLNFIRDIYQYWLQKRKKKNNLPLIRQFQPPLWEVYKKQVHNWEMSIKNRSNQKPALFAFCLKPRGLINNSNYYSSNNNYKDSKQRSHKKLLTSGPHCYSPNTDLDSALSEFAKRSSYEASCSPRTGGITGLANGRKPQGINIMQSKWICPVGSDVAEFKSRDAARAAVHAANMARFKREKAMLLLQKADLAMYKASCAVLIAGAVEKSQKDSSIGR